MSGRPPSLRLTLVDLTGLVLGFAGAGTIYRGTILAVHEAGAVGLALVAAVSFLWLGSVIAGPVVLGMRRLQHGRHWRLAPGESIWLVLGLMWIAVGVARGLRELDPVTMSNAASLTAAAAAGLAPLVLILRWRLERTRVRAAASSPAASNALPPPAYSWCHHVGIFCAATWPAAWTLAAFLLGM
jgi:hypothetical protein